MMYSVLADPFDDEWEHEMRNLNEPTTKNEEAEANLAAAFMSSPDPVPMLWKIIQWTN